MELWLVRHGKAGEPGARWPDDRQRPLTEAGRRQAQRVAALLGRVEVAVDRIFTSPLLRAVQTAEPLGVLLPAGGRVEVLEALAQPGPEVALAALQAGPAARASGVICVGHAPQMAQIAAVLMGAPPSGATLAVGKATVVGLEGELRPGGMTLHALLPFRLVAAFDAPT